MHRSKYKPEKQPSFRDPVCGMEVSRTTAIDECEYLGKVYYFCAPSCREEFEANPEKYIHHDRQHRSHVS